MGWYSRVLFPRFVESSLKNSAMAQLRNRVLANASGEVLEIGLGTGLNLPYYPMGVSRISSVDNNPGMSLLAKRRIALCPIPVEMRVLDAETLPFDSHSFDCIVSTWTLCSIADLGQALSELKRVLKPHGKILFVEHGRSPEPSVQQWQRRLEPLQKRIGDGCHLTRDIQGALLAAGFEVTACEQFYVEKMPKTHGYMTLGIATP